MEMEIDITPHARALMTLVKAEHERTGVITYYPFIRQPTVVVFDPVDDVSRARNCWHAYVVYPRSAADDEADGTRPGDARLSSLVEHTRHFALLRLAAFSAAAPSLLPALPDPPNGKPRE